MSYTDEWVNFILDRDCYDQELKNNANKDIYLSNLMEEYAKARLSELDEEIYQLMHKVYKIGKLYYNGTKLTFTQSGMVNIIIGQEESLKGFLTRITQNRS